MLIPKKHCFSDIIKIAFNQKYEYYQKISEIDSINSKMLLKLQKTHPSSIKIYLHKFISLNF